MVTLATYRDQRHIFKELGEGTSSKILKKDVVRNISTSCKFIVFIYFFTKFKLYKRSPKNFMSLKKTH